MEFAIYLDFDQNLLKIRILAKRNRGQVCHTMAFFFFGSQMSYHACLHCSMHYFYTLFKNFNMMFFSILLQNHIQFSPSFMFLSSILINTLVIDQHKRHSWIHLVDTLWIYNNLVRTSCRLYSHTSKSQSNVKKKKKNPQNSQFIP